MAIEFGGMEWDDGNWPKCGKHGVSKEEIEAVLLNGPNIYSDRSVSATETRLNAVGYTAAGRAVFVVFTLRRQGDGSNI